MNDSGNNRKGLSYKDAGVDIDAGNALVQRIKPAVARTHRPEVLTGLGGFGGLFRLAARHMDDPILVSGTDGVGTKLMLARMLNRHESIGQDLVAMCVNDILVLGAEPLFFLDYFACGELNLDQAEIVIRGIADGCETAGCALIGGETAEMPGMYPKGEYDLAGFAVGVVDRAAMIDGSAIQPGMQLLGLSSSGPHSNGYSLIRKVIETQSIDLAMPLPGDPALSLGEALMQPTRIYAGSVLSLLPDLAPAGIAHITGGGLKENIDRVLPDHLGIRINTSNWARPAIFQWLQQAGNIAESEMLRAFNCGIGLVLVVDEGAATETIDHLTARGDNVHRIGEVVEHGADDRVQIDP